MSDFYRELIKYRIMLENKIFAGEGFLENANEGYLSCNIKAGNVRYYLKGNSKNQKPRYLSAKDSDLVYELAQKKYYRQLLPIMKEEKLILDSLVNLLNKCEKEKCYSEAREFRKSLIKPEFKTPEDNAADWLAIETNRKEINPDAKTFLSRNGESVRSKSEKIIADELLFRDIPYKYESELKLGSITIYPDFTVLNKRTGKIYYLEHLGMMDNTEYYSGVLKRLSLYSQNDIYIGDRLLLTYESSHYPINSFQLNHIIDEYLI